MKGKSRAEAPGGAGGAGKSRWVLVAGRSPPVPQLHRALPVPLSLHPSSKCCNPPPWNDAKAAANTARSDSACRRAVGWDGTSADPPVQPRCGLSRAHGEQQMLLDWAQLNLSQVRSWGCEVSHAPQEPSALLPRRRLSVTVASGPSASRLTAHLCVPAALAPLLPLLSEVPELSSPQILQSLLP